ncbi:MAG TPA: hypothetical protein VJN92_05490 [Candidatus Acidoferrum sp.]|nr:hypothetical protein [Candidatus Acidoferrum sp.]
MDEAAFDAHPKLPHMTRFLSLARELVTHPVKGIRTKQIDECRCQAEIDF